MLREREGGRGGGGEERWGVGREEEGGVKTRKKKLVGVEKIMSKNS